MNRDPEDPRHPRDMRVLYNRSNLDESHLANCPLDQFRIWFDEITRSGVEREPNAMSLATVDAEGRPSVRTVLLKGGLEKDAFWFFTNYTSKKGRDLAVNPHAALVFVWKEWERQVCVRGPVEKLPHEDTRVYFESRPYESQIGAWTSRQSEPIPGREWLEERNAALRARYPEGEVPCPDFWGGYTLRPLVMEFWQGRPGRLHDRFHFERDGLDSPWKSTRVCP
jgi:pyridoxamine 5'-phosphate oxidase